MDKWVVRIVSLTLLPSLLLDPTSAAQVYSLSSPSPRHVSTLSLQAGFNVQAFEEPLLIAPLRVLAWASTHVNASRLKAAQNRRFGSAQNKSGLLSRKVIRFVFKTKLGIGGLLSLFSALPAFSSTQFFQEVTSSRVIDGKTMEVTTHLKAVVDHGGTLSGISQEMAKRTDLVQQFGKAPNYMDIYHRSKDVIDHTITQFHHAIGNTPWNQIWPKETLTVADKTTFVSLPGVPSMDPHVLAQQLPTVTPLSPMQQLLIHPSWHHVTAWLHSVPTVDLIAAGVVLMAVAYAGHRLWRRFHPRTATRHGKPSGDQHSFNKEASAPAGEAIEDSDHSSPDPLFHILNPDFENPNKKTVSPPATKNQPSAPGSAVLPVAPPSVGEAPVNSKGHAVGLRSMNNGTGHDLDGQPVEVDGQRSGSTPAPSPVATSTTENESVPAMAVSAYQWYLRLLIGLIAVNIPSIEERGQQPLFHILNPYFENKGAVPTPAGQTIEDAETANEQPAGSNPKPLSATTPKNQGHAMGLIPMNNGAGRGLDGQPVEVDEQRVDSKPGHVSTSANLTRRHRDNRKAPPSAPGQTVPLAEPPSLGEARVNPQGHVVGIMPMNDTLGRSLDGQHIEVDGQPSDSTPAPSMPVNNALGRGLEGQPTEIDQPFDGHAWLQRLTDIPDEGLSLDVAELGMTLIQGNQMSHEVSQDQAPPSTPGQAMLPVVPHVATRATKKKEAPAMTLSAYQWYLRFLISLIALNIPSADEKLPSQAKPSRDPRPLFHILNPNFDHSNNETVPTPARQGHGVGIMSTANTLRRGLEGQPVEDDGQPVIDQGHVVGIMPMNNASGRGLEGQPIEVGRPFNWRAWFLQFAIDIPSDLMVADCLGLLAKIGMRPPYPFTYPLALPAPEDHPELLPVPANVIESSQIIPRAPKDQVHGVSPSRKVPPTAPSSSGAHVYPFTYQRALSAPEDHGGFLPVLLSLFQHGRISPRAPAVLPSLTYVPSVEIDSHSFNWYDWLLRFIADIPDEALTVDCLALLASLTRITPQVQTPAPGKTAPSTAPPLSGTRVYPFTYQRALSAPEDHAELLPVPLSLFQHVRISPKAPKDQLGLPASETPSVTPASEAYVPIVDRQGRAVGIAPVDNKAGRNLEEQSNKTDGQPSGSIPVLFFGYQRALPAPQDHPELLPVPANVIEYGQITPHAPKDQVHGASPSRKVSPTAAPASGAHVYPFTYQRALSAPEDHAELLPVPLSLFQHVRINPKAPKDQLGLPASETPSVTPALEAYVPIVDRQGRAVGIAPVDDKAGRNLEEQSNKTDGQPSGSTPALFFGYQRALPAPQNHPELLPIPANLFQHGQIPPVVPPSETYVPIVDLQSRVVGHPFNWRAWLLQFAVDIPSDLMMADCLELLAKVGMGPLYSCTYQLALPAPQDQAPSPTSGQAVPPAVPPSAGEVLVNPGHQSGTHVYPFTYQRALPAPEDHREFLPVLLSLFQHGRISPPVTPPSEAYVPIVDRQGRVVGIAPIDSQSSDSTPALFFGHQRALPAPQDHPELLPVPANVIQRGKISPQAPKDQVGSPETPEVHAGPNRFENRRQEERELGHLSTKVTKERKRWRAEMRRSQADDESDWDHDVEVEAERVSPADRNEVSMRPDRRTNRTRRVRSARNEFSDDTDEMLPKASQRQGGKRNLRQLIREAEGSAMDDAWETSLEQDEAALSTPAGKPVRPSARPAVDGGRHQTAREDRAALGPSRPPSKRVQRKRELDQDLLEAQLTAEDAAWLDAMARDEADALRPKGPEPVLTDAPVSEISARRTAKEDAAVIGRNKRQPRSRTRQKQDLRREQQRDAEVVDRQDALYAADNESSNASPNGSSSRRRPNVPVVRTLHKNPAGYFAFMLSLLRIKIEDAYTTEQFEACRSRFEFLANLAEPFVGDPRIVDLFSETALELKAARERIARDINGPRYVILPIRSESEFNAEVQALHDQLDHLTELQARRLALLQQRTPRTPDEEWTLMKMNAVIGHEMERMPDVADRLEALRRFQRPVPANDQTASPRVILQIVDESLEEPLPVPPPESRHAEMRSQANRAIHRMLGLPAPLPGDPPLLPIPRVVPVTIGLVLASAVLGLAGFDVFAHRLFIIALHNPDLVLTHGVITAFKFGVAALPLSLPVGLWVKKFQAPPPIEVAIPTQPKSRIPSIPEIGARVNTLTSLSAKIQSVYGHEKLAHSTAVKKEALRPSKGVPELRVVGPATSEAKVRQPLTDWQAAEQIAVWAAYKIAYAAPNFMRRLRHQPPRRQFLPSLEERLYGPSTPETGLQGWVEHNVSSEDLPEFTMSQQPPPSVWRRTGQIFVDILLGPAPSIGSNALLQKIEEQRARPAWAGTSFGYKVLQQWDPLARPTSLQRFLAEAAESQASWPLLQAEYHQLQDINPTLFDATVDIMRDIAFIYSIVPYVKDVESLQNRVAARHHQLADKTQWDQLKRRRAILPLEKSAPGLAALIDDALKQTERGLYGNVKAGRVDTTPLRHRFELLGQLLAHINSLESLGGPDIIDETGSDAIVVRHLAKEAQDAGDLEQVPELFELYQRIRTRLMEVQMAAYTRHAELPPVLAQNRSSAQALQERISIVAAEARNLLADVQSAGTVNTELRMRLSHLVVKFKGIMFHSDNGSRALFEQRNSAIQSAVKDAYAVLSEIYRLADVGPLSIPQADALLGRVTDSKSGVRSRRGAVSLVFSASVSLLTLAAAAPPSSAIDICLMIMMGTGLVMYGDRAVNRVIKRKSEAKDAADAVVVLDLMIGQRQRELTKALDAAMREKAIQTMMQKDKIFRAYIAGLQTFQSKDAIPTPTQWKALEDQYARDYASRRSLAEPLTPVRHKIQAILKASEERHAVHSLATPPVLRQSA